MRAAAFVLTLTLAVAATATTTATTTDDVTTTNERINTQRNPSIPSTGIDVTFAVATTSPHTHHVCWAPHSTEEYDGPPICTEPVSAGHNASMYTIVGHRFAVTPTADPTPVMFEAVGGQHVYHVDNLYPPLLLFPGAPVVVHVRTPDTCPVDGWESMGPVWRDAIRRAAFRRGHPLCLCGAWNDSTTYTAEVPNPELPTILTSLHRLNDGDGDSDSDSDGSSQPHPACRCDRPDGAHGAPYYDLYWPCSVDRRDGQMLLELETCSGDGQQGDGWAQRRVGDGHGADAARRQVFAHTRVAVVHTTMMVDRLSMKGKMWESLRAVYGADRAAVVMPASYHTALADQRRLLLEHCQRVTSAAAAAAAPDGSVPGHFFIIKNELHRQQGISITSAAHIAADGGALRGDFTFATQFLPRPYLVRGHKLNMRRYMVAVCTGGRLRGYVHDDGKNIYTKNTYRDPWEVAPEDGFRQGLSTLERAGLTDLDLLKQRLDDLITTGYVPASHYDDKPLSGLEFFAAVTAAGGNHTLFQRSMWARLALALHASRAHGEYDLCTVDADRLNAAALPHCLHGAVRFQHFGCDFHVDRALTGYESRLFECNKGPDMHPHSYRDGTMKRDVAADIVAFVGFVGEFEGSDAAARRHRMHLIYDSESFDVDATFAFLDGLADAPRGAGADTNTGRGGGGEEL